VGSDTLAFDLPLLPIHGTRISRKIGNVDFWVLYYFQLVLLVGVEEFVERVRWEANGFGDQRGEERGDVRHALHVVFIHWSKFWEVLR
jgi:hypothetical protein